MLELNNQDFTVARPRAPGAGRRAPPAGAGEQKVLVCEAKWDRTGILEAQLKEHHSIAA
jgi:hypothetical protein